MGQRSFKGYIRLHRQLLEHRLWQRERFTWGQAWVDLLLRAAHKDHDLLVGSKTVQIRRGQVFTSQARLAKDWGWTRETVRNFIRYLKSEEMAAMETSKRAAMGYTVVTICNYGFWQGEAGDGAAMLKEGDAAMSSAMPAAMLAATIKNEKNEKKAGVVAPGGRPPSRNGNEGDASDFHKAVKVWFELFEAARGVKPQFDGAEGQQLNRLLTAHGVEAVQEAMRHLLYHTRLSWITKRYGYSIKTLAGSWNELVSEAQARRQAEAVG